MDENKYPHWKEALFGNDGAVANLRCAIKYGLWHVSYFLLAMLGIVLVITLDILGWVTRTSLVKHANTVITHRWMKKAGRIVALGAGILTLLIIIVVLGSEAVQNPLGLLISIGAGIGVLAIGTILIYAYEITRDVRSALFSRMFNTFHRIGEHAVETPGVRRVYGRCPVHMDIEPKWFENFFGMFEDDE